MGVREVGVRPLLGHVAKRDGAVDVPPLVVAADIVDDADRPAQDHLAVRRIAFVDRQAHTAVATQMGEPGRPLPGSNQECAVENDEPSRDDERRAVLIDRADTHEVAGLGEEGTNLVMGKCGHGEMMPVDLTIGTTRMAVVILGNRDREWPASHSRC